MEAARSSGAQRAWLADVIAVVRGRRIARRRVIVRALIEAGALLLPIAVVGATHGAGPELWVASAAYAAGHVMLALRAAAAARRRTRFLAWSAARVLFALLIVGVGQLATDATGLLAVVYVLVIGMSAFAGRFLLVVATFGAVAFFGGVELITDATLNQALQRSAGFAAAVAVVAAGMSLEVRRLASARDRLKLAVTDDRRRARQIAGVEAIGRILASHGHTTEVLDRAIDRISTQFGYGYVSLYLGDGDRVQLGAQRGYGQLLDSFDNSRGVVGRVMRTAQPAFVPDVAADPDYWGLNPDVHSEICVPLVNEGEFLGFLNVESTAGRPLDSTDLRLMVAVGDRMAAALIISRERMRLSERVELFRTLHEFSEAINGTLEPDALYATIVRSVPSVVAADMTALVILDRATGRYHLRAIDGTDRVELGVEFRPGEGMAGRAIRDRTLIIDEQYAPASYPASITTYVKPAIVEDQPMQAASLPLIRDRAVVGALTVLRRDSTQSFSDLDRDALAMIAEQAALAVANAFLHGDVADMAVRDPLTGLFNRRYLDPAIQQLLAQRLRVSEADRPAVSVIMFDLDHFSDLNNRYGHQAGDAVLRSFSALLRARVRSTDIVARYGGEEFAAVLFRAGLDEAMQVAEQVREQFAATRVAGPGEVELSATVSAGCAVAAPGTESPEDLLRAADVALYMAKRAGRNRVVAA